MLFKFAKLLALLLYICWQRSFAQSTNFRKNVDEMQNLFPLTIIHVNDMHARYDEINIQTGICKANETCIGGYARVIETVRMLQRLRSNPIYLNAGDNFVGTIWYSIGRWNVTSHFLNLHNADVITLGNHEFDYGVAGVVPFIDTIEAPLTLANVDVSLEPSLQGKLRKSVILTRGGRRIGVIGVINRFTNELAVTENIQFLDETEVVRNESLRLKKTGVDIIIILSHCGLDIDYEIAANGGPYIDVIVGAHTHSFLYTGSHAPGPDTPVAEYPVVITQTDGRKVLIVQASAFTKYIGDLTIYFDAAGNVVHWKGAPIFMGPNIQQDRQILAEIQPWKLLFDNITQQYIAYANKKINGLNCFSGECEMGNLLADTYRNHYLAQNKSLDAALVVAIVHSGGIRASLEKGPITYGDVDAVQPFSHFVDSLDMTGQNLIDIFEYNVQRAFGQEFFVKLLQVSGLRVTYNKTNPIGQRVVLLETLCRRCEPNAIQQYEPIDKMQTYRVVTLNYLINGGDGFTIITRNKRNHVIGRMELDIIVESFGKAQYIDAKVEGRINILN